MDRALTRTNCILNENGCRSCRFLWEIAPEPGTRSLFALRQQRTQDLSTSKDARQNPSGRHHAGYVVGMHRKQLSDDRQNRAAAHNRPGGGAPWTQRGAASPVRYRSGQTRAKGREPEAHLSGRDVTKRGAMRKLLRCFLTIRSACHHGKKSC